MRSDKDPAPVRSDPWGPYAADPFYEPPDPHGNWRRAVEEARRVTARRTGVDIRGDAAETDQGPANDRVRRV